MCRIILDYRNTTVISAELRPRKSITEEMWLLTTSQFDIESSDPDVLAYSLPFMRSIPRVATCIHGFLIPTKSMPKYAALSISQASRTLGNMQYFGGRSGTFDHCVHCQCSSKGGGKTFQHFCSLTSVYIDCSYRYNLTHIDSLLSW